MKRIAFSAALIFALAAVAGATPYNTITVDGVWGAAEWDQANETRVSNTFPGWSEFGNVRDILVTWDASNLYVGVKGNSWNNAMLIYIDSSSITTGQENADFFQGYDTQSFFDPDFVAGHFNMQWGSGGIPTDIRSISAIDGSTVSLLPTAAIDVKDQNSDGGLGEGFTEIAIPWSLIGLETGGSVKVACGVGWANNQSPVIPAGGLGGFSGDELGGTDQQGGTDALDGTLDTPAMVVYDGDGDGLPDQLTDETPPTLIEACTLAGDRSAVIATFDEPVGETSAEIPANWSITGGASVVSATLQANPAVVHLQLDGELGFGESFTVTATGIDDLSGNTSGATSTNFCLAELTVIALMSFKILSAGGLDAVAIEGSLAPLTWDPTCDHPLVDDGTGGDAVAGDSLYPRVLEFCLPYGDGEEPPVIPLVYKLTFGCTEWESIENHYYNDPGLSCATGQDVIEIWWNDENPDNFTTAPVDVVFSVDLSDSLGARLLAGINGGTGGGGAAPPLNWNIPSENELTDADYPGGVLGDGVFGAILRFPENTLKNIQYKYLYNDEYECTDQGNREVFLNTAAFDTLGGANGALILPVARWNRCTVTSRAVEVMLSVDVNAWSPPPGGGDIVAVNGTPNNQEPPVINWEFPSINPMTDAGGGIYTHSIIFPDSSEKFVEYKYAINEVFECLIDQGNRFFWIDSDNFGTSGPQILELDVFDECDPVGIEDGMADAAVLRLDANYPNPFNPKTSIRFTLNEATKVDLRIYDMSGRLVRVLLRAEAPAGDHTVAWNGRNDAGRLVTSGIYFARIAAANEVQSRKMTLLK